MSELGQWLREARQAKGLSLEQTEAQTHIRIKFLTALEEGNYEDLPSEVYTRGFVRNYALFLDLDPTQALEKYDKSKTDRQSSEPSFFRPLEVALFRASIERFRGRLVLLLLIAGAITVGLWAWRTGRLVWPPPFALFQATATPTATPPSSRTPMRTASQPTVTKRPTATAQLTATPTHSPTSLLPTPTSGLPLRPTSTPTSTIAPTESLSPTITLQPGTGVTLSITVTEECWVEVTVDSRNVLRELLQPGDQRNWEAGQEIILRLGNAGGVQVTLNGEFLGNLGERQQVVEFVWGAEGEITPQPTFTATATLQETPQAAATPTSQTR